MACGNSNSGNVENTDEGKFWYLGRNVSSKDFSEIQDTLDAAEMYSTIKYDEKMLGGRYVLYNEKKILIHLLYSMSNIRDLFQKKIEGHIAPVAGSTYESGLSLSQERADAVKSYCLSAANGVYPENISELTSTMEAVGMSNAAPVYDQSGNVDMAASRRVSFRFIINLD